MIAIGVGCRRGTQAGAIEFLIRQTLRQVPAGRAALFSIEDKAGEAGLIEAAERLDLTLNFLPRDALRAQTPGVQTRSPRAEAEFGVASVAEAAALAGAGLGGVLIVPRIACQGVTCAIAAGP